MRDETVDSFDKGPDVRSGVVADRTDHLHVIEFIVAEVRGEREDHKGSSCAFRVDLEVPVLEEIKALFDVSQVGRYEPLWILKDLLLPEDGPESGDRGVAASRCAAHSNSGCLR